MVQFNKTDLTKITLNGQNCYMVVPGTGDGSLPIWVNTQNSDTDGYSKSFNKTQTVSLKGKSNSSTDSLSFTNYLAQTICIEIADPDLSGDEFTITANISTNGARRATLEFNVDGTDTYLKKIKWYYPSDGDLAIEEDINNSKKAREVWAGIFWDKNGSLWAKYNTSNGIDYASDEIRYSGGYNTDIKSATVSFTYSGISGTLNREPTITVKCFGWNV